MKNNIICKKNRRSIPEHPIWKRCEKKYNQK